MRVRHLLPYSIQQAELRLAELRQLYLSPRDTVYAAYRYAVEDYVERQQLLQHVRNVKVIDMNEENSLHRLSHDPVGGGTSRCFPFTACASLPCTSNFLITGACDGLLTVWDTEVCRPLVSHPGNQGSRSFTQCPNDARGLPHADTRVYAGRMFSDNHPLDCDHHRQGMHINSCTTQNEDGAIREGEMDDDDDDIDGGGGVCPVKAIVAHPTLPLFFTRTMFDSCIRGWKLSCEEGRTVEETALEMRKKEQEEEEDEGRGRSNNFSSLSFTSSRPRSIQLLPICSLKMDASVTSREGGASGSQFRSSPPCRSEGSYPRQSLAMDPSGGLIASGGPNGTVRVWDVRGVVGEVQGAEMINGASGYPSSHLAFSSFRNNHFNSNPQNSSSGSFHSLSSFFIRCPPIVQWGDDPDAHHGRGVSGMTDIYATAFHPDGALLSTGNAGGQVITWDLRSGKVAFHTTLTNASQHSPSRRSLGNSGDVDGGGLLHHAHLNAVTCIAWSFCGQRLATGGRDGVVHLWDARQLHRISNPTTTANSNRSSGGSARSSATSCSHLFVGHEDEVTSLSFRPCPPVFFKENQGGVGVLGRRLPLSVVTTSLDQTIRWWDMNTGVCVKVLHADGPVRSHAWINGGIQDGSLVTIVHGKSWSLWGVRNRKSDSTSKKDGKEHPFNESCQTVETNEVVRVPSRSYPAHSGNPDTEEDDEDAEEDEMKALQSNLNRTLHNIHKNPPEGNIHHDETEDEEEDEMAMLMRGA